MRDRGWHRLFCSKFVVDPRTVLFELRAPLMLDHVLLWLNARRHEVRGRDAFLSLSDYLRRTCGLTGTKIVCSEGDCGACTVLVGRVAADGARLVYRPLDSCIQFLFQLDGT